MFGTDELAPNEEEIEDVKQNARERLVLWRRRALYSTAAMLLSFLAVYPFLAGSPLHAHWESFGKFLVLLSGALSIAFVYYTAMWWGAWSALRDVEKGKFWD